MGFAGRKGANLVGLSDAANHELGQVRHKFRSFPFPLLSAFRRVRSRKDD